MKDVGKTISLGIKAVSWSLWTSLYVAAFYNIKIVIQFHYDWSSNSSSTIPVIVIYVWQHFDKQVFMHCCVVTRVAMVIDFFCFVLQSLGVVWQKSSSQQRDSGGRRGCPSSWCRQAGAAAVLVFYGSNAGWWSACSIILHLRHRRAAAVGQHDVVVFSLIVIVVSGQHQLVVVASLSGLEGSSPTSSNSSSSASSSVLHRRSTPSPSLLRPHHDLESMHQQLPSATAASVMTGQSRGHAPLSASCKGPYFSSLYLVLHVQCEWSPWWCSPFRIYWPIQLCSTNIISYPSVWNLS